MYNINVCVHVHPSIAGFLDFAFFFKELTLTGENEKVDHQLHVSG